MSKIIIASGPVIVENNKVLLNQSGDTENLWKFCGGKVIETDENLTATAKRRSNEEMGIDIKILDENPFLMHTHKETPEGRVDVILVHYLAKRVGEIKPDKEVSQWDWIDLDNLQENLAPNIIPTLKYFGFIK